MILDAFYDRVAPLFFCGSTIWEVKVSLYAEN